MVTAEYYIKAFFKGIEQRQQALGNLISQKQEVQRGYAEPHEEQTIAALIKIIGQNVGRREGKIENQSIRHLLSRMSKSAVFLGQNRDKIIGKLANTSAEKDMSCLIDWLNESLNNFEAAVIKLERNYADQATALNKNNFAQYLRLNTQEKLLIVALSDIGQKLAIEAKLKVSRLQYILEKRPKELKLIITAGAMIIVSVGILGALCGVNWAVLGGGIMTALAGVSLAGMGADIKRTLDEYKTEIWIPL